MTDILRQKTKQYITVHGSTGVFISRSIGISKSMLCQYLNGSKNLGKKNLEKLAKFLVDRGEKYEI